MCLHATRQYIRICLQGKPDKIYVTQLIAENKVKFSQKTGLIEIDLAWHTRVTLPE